MAERRTEIMAFTGTLAGIGIAVAALVATSGNKPVSNPWFILGVVVGVASTTIFVFAGVSALPGWVRPLLEARRRPDPLIVNRWRYTTEGLRVPAVTVAMEVSLPGTSAMQKDDRPPWVRFVVTMACSEIDVDDDPDLHYLNFEWLLEKPLVRSLVRELTAFPDEAAWWRWSAARPGVHEAVLGTYRKESLAMASARLELPAGGPPLYGRDGRCATLILHIEPRHEEGRPAAPQPPEFWEARIEQALGLPKLLAELLAVLGLRTSGEPPAQVGVRLEAARDLAEMVDITGRHPMRGAIRGSQAIGSFVADRGGKSADEASVTMVRDMLLYALKTSYV